MSLPIYKCVIDDSIETDLQVEFVALVDKPAIEKNFQAFKDVALKFAIDKDKHIISGPVMLADMLIYRNDETLGEYYTMFDKETIMSIVQKFFKKGFINNFNVMHDDNMTVPGITIFESFMTDAARGIMPMKGFEDVKDGSWFISAKVEDDATWEKIKAGTLKGFSVEGIFKQVKVKMRKMTAENAMKQIQAIMAMVEE